MGFYLAVILLLAPQVGFSADSTPRVSGFISAIGAGTDSDYVYTSGTDKEFGLHANSRFGLNISTSLSENIDAAIQFNATMNRLDTPVSVDWGFVTYHFLPGLSLRVGKQKFPIWLISDYYDVGFAYPWARAPDEVYSLAPISSFNGATIAYEPSFGSFDLSLEMFAGAIQRTFGDINSKGESNETTVAVTKLSGAAASFSNGIFTVRGSYARSNLDITAQGGAFSRSNLLNELASVGLKFEWKNLMLYSEYATSKETKSASLKAEGSAAEAAAQSAQLAYIAAVQASGAESSEAQAALQELTNASTASYLANGDIAGYTGYYVTIGYKVGKLTPHFTYAHKNEPDLPLFSETQTSMTLGTRYETSDRSCIKFDYQVIEPENDNSKGLFTTTEQEPKIGTANIIRFGMDVIF